MYKKILIPLLLIILVLKIPISSLAAPENAPFVLKDALTGYVDLSAFQAQIDEIWSAIKAIQPSTGSGQSIKVYDSNDKYIGLFVGKESNYSIFIERLNKFIHINPRLLTFFPIGIYYPDESCSDSSIYAYMNGIDPNEIYNINNKWFFGSPNNDDIVTHVYEKTINGDCLDLGVSTNSYIKLIETTDFSLPPDLQPPLQLRYE